MADEVKDESGNVQTPATPTPPAPPAPPAPAAPKPPEEDRTGKRISDLTEAAKKADDDRLKAEQERDVLKAEKEKREQDEALTKLQATQPAVGEHKDEIVSKAKEKGLTLEEATIIVLNSHGKFSSPSASNAAFTGGAAAPASIRPVESDHSKMTTEEKKAKLLAMFQEMPDTELRETLLKANRS